MAAAATLRVTINGEAREIGGDLSLLALLAELNLDNRRIAVERNLEIVPRSAYGQTVLAEGDRLEIVNFVGGGDHREPQ
ncbi:MAG TPA: thiamine biosynthesis protein ThiS, partial [Alphaproteobacteria bacterium]|nr:thiamine biosynthesis protein ThiS [Alphaproteobacteria bacterium]